MGLQELGILIGMQIKKMKLLASVTIILSIPNIISGFFGMNVNFAPIIQHNPNMPTILAVVTLAVTLAVVVLFYRKDWF